MTTDAPNDRALVAAFLRTRAEDSFRVIYERHTPALYLLALRMLGGARREAEDAVQETWIRATTRLPAFRWESSLKTWLGGIAINCCREIQRRPREDGMPAEVPLRPSTGDRVDLETAIRGLAPGYRDVFVLHDVEGRSHEEIASMLGIDAGTSRSQLHKARRALRAALTERKS
jgi:RNA polymerase sigma-70 factor, ECF subfamily